MPSKGTTTSLANRWCGLIKALSELDVEIREGFWPRAIQVETGQFAEAVRELWPERFSANYLRKRIQRLGVELAAQPITHETSRRFAAFLSELDEYVQRKLCVAAVDGIELASDDDVVFGPFVLRRATPGYLEKVYAYIDRSIAVTPHSEQEKAGFSANFRRDAQEALSGSIVLELEIIADAEQAHAVFEDEAGKLMDLLQMSTAIVEYCSSARIGLRGTIHAGAYSAWVFLSTAAISFNRIAA